MNTPSGTAAASPAASRIAPNVPGWALPLAGGLLLTAVVVAWLTSAVWLFSEVGIRS